MKIVMTFYLNSGSSVLSLECDDKSNNYVTKKIWYLIIIFSLLALSERKDFFYILEATYI